MSDDAHHDAQHARIVALEATVDRLTLQTSACRDLVAEYAAQPCTYDDKCPPCGTWHGTCLPCKSRRALTVDEEQTP
jgi:pyrimidine deaminase RibD-like protein